MKNIDELIELNSYDPISRYLKVICEEKEGIKGLTLKILFSLKAIDVVLQQICSTDYHFYIKDDTTIYILLCNIYGGKKIERSEFDKSMFILDFCKLIYRFTCAKKFKEKDSHIFQLRLNSWGRDYMKSHAKNKEYCMIKEYIDSYCQNNFQMYFELTKLLLGDLSRGSVRAIENFNSTLEVKLLS